MKAETLQKINEALARLEEGKYGYCFECGEEIAEQRLRALPFAVRCKDCEEAREVAEQRERIATRLHSMLTAPRPDYLATADERTMLERIDILDGQLRGAGEGALPGLERVARLRGALTWRLETEYHARLTDAHEHLFELDQHVDALKARYAAFVRARQAATHSYVGYDAGIARLRDRVAAALQRVTIVMARQGHAIEMVAINQLRARRERLVAQQTQARYAVADSYDRATEERVAAETAGLPAGDSE